MERWWTIRQERLRAAIMEIRRKKLITVIQPFAMTDNDIPGINVRFADHKQLLDNSDSHVDIFFSQGYAHNISDLWDVVRSGRSTVTACWFWDNHHLFASTMRAAMLSDVSFCAHKYYSSYVDNELGRYGGFAPLCPVFWNNALVRHVMAGSIGVTRSDRLYGGYNSYPEFPQRNVFLAACMEAIPENDMVIWPVGTRPENHAYYRLPAEEKLREWCRYKVAVCASFGVNTTIRMFESLLSGQIPIVVGTVTDLDSIIPPNVQAMLPLIRVKDLDPLAVRNAYLTALQQFDAGGQAGISRRSNYILENHMPRNRIIKMVDTIRNIEV